VLAGLVGTFLVRDLEADGNPGARSGTVLRWQEKETQDVQVSGQADP
jgi:hypothetical protein